jgi:hypothetical protein
MGEKEFASAATPIFHQCQTLMDAKGRYDA